jgi:hypothetical protein
VLDGIEVAAHRLALAEATRAGRPDEELAAWLDRALAHADRIDPISNGPWPPRGDSERQPVNP